MAYAREGAKIVIVDVDVDGGELTARLIRAAGGTANLVHADVSKASEAQQMVDRAVEIYGRLDCALNNAGVAGRDRNLMADYAEADWDRVIGNN